MIFYFLMSLAIGQDTDREIEYQKRTEIDFEGIDGTGALVKPQGSLLMERQRTAFNPMIRLRADFNQEIGDSVREIK
jgi:hypothetical protein